MKNYFEVLHTSNISNEALKKYIDVLPSFTNICLHMQGKWWQVHSLPDHFPNTKTTTPFQRFYESLVRGFISKGSGFPEEPLHTLVAVGTGHWQQHSRLRGRPDTDIGEKRVAEARINRDVELGQSTGARLVKEGEIAGLITFQVLPLSKCQDADWLDIWQPDLHPDVVYILNLGTEEVHRRKGIGRVLLGRCLDHARRSPSVGAVYLHVITENHQAMSFYQSEGFERVGEIPEYYYINEKLYDGYIYAKYFNRARASYATRLGLGIIFRSGCEVWYYVMESLMLDSCKKCSDSGGKITVYCLCLIPFFLVEDTGLLKQDNVYLNEIFSVAKRATSSTVTFLFYAGSLNRISPP
ncbi:unnamed protein product [Choristocarpus tenellus]